MSTNPTYPVFEQYVSGPYLEPFSVSLSGKAVTVLLDEESCINGLHTELVEKADSLKMCANYPLISVGNTFTNWHMDSL